MDHILQQLDGQQHIPYEPLNIDRFHEVDACGNDVWWLDYHNEFHSIWDSSG